MRTGHLRDAGACRQYRPGRRIPDETGLRHQTVSDSERFPFGERGDHQQFAALSIDAGGLRQEADDAAG